MFRKKIIAAFSTAILLLLGGILLMFAASKLLDKKSETVEIVSGQIGNDFYFVPKDYLVFPGRGLMEDSIYITFSYPDFKPIKRRGVPKNREWVNDIRIVASYNPNLPPVPIVVDKGIKIFKATHFVGEEYGLLHYRQPDGGNQDDKDVWKIENNPNSYFTCTEKILSSDIPQCRYNMYWRKFGIQVSFDKNLLKEWKNITSEVDLILHSFTAEQTAKIYYLSKMNSGGD